MVQGLNINVIFGPNSKMPWPEDTFSKVKGTMRKASTIPVFKIEEFLAFWLQHDLTDPVSHLSCRGRLSYFLLGVCFD